LESPVCHLSPPPGHGPPGLAACSGGLGLPLADGIRLENDLSTLLRTTEDRVEGAKAFVEKRKPKWTGK
jgi:1,4-dihydroxy-2-naphthoyl-CoA synthase